MKSPFHLEIRRAGEKVRHQKLEIGVYSLGSDANNRIVLEADEIAWRHAILTLTPEGLWIEDLSSDSGTWVEGCRIAGRTPITPRQEIVVGPYHLLLAADQQEPKKIPLPPAAPAASEPADDAHLEQKRLIKEQIHRELLERMDIKRISTTRLGYAELSQRAQKILAEIMREIKSRLPDGITPDLLIKEVHDEALGLGALEDLLADPEITEIMVNGPKQVYIEKQGRIERTQKSFLNNDSVLAIIERIVAPLGRRIDESQPYVDARLKDGSRVNAIIPPLSLSGPCLIIRKFARTPFTDADLIRFGTLTRTMADFLRICVLLRKNMIVSGGTGSGKTTFLNVLSNYLPEADRIVTIEDAAELRLAKPHVVRLEARPPNIEGKGAVTIRDLVRNALRMRPDRIVVGECRGGESLDMLQAMNTGHDGSLTTIHANSPRDVISRLETMVLMSGMDLPIRAIREQIASAIDVIIHEARFNDGSRKIISVTEIVGLEGDMITMQELFAFRQTGVGSDGLASGYFTATGAVPTFIEEVRTKGLAFDQSIFNPAAWGAGKKP